jgi:uncharacterized surface protein with fasciclin (FAS1) repeats
MASQEGISQNQTVDPGIDRRLQTLSIAETLQRFEDCSNLLEFVRQTDTAYLLERGGLHTFFAVNNNAFVSAPVSIQGSVAEEFIANHLVRGAFETFDLHRVSQLQTESGNTVPVKTENGKTQIGNASLLRSDIACTNGVMHVIDRPLA